MTQTHAVDAVIRAIKERARRLEFDVTLCPEWSEASPIESVLSADTESSVEYRAAIRVVQLRSSDFGVRTVVVAPVDRDRDPATGTGRAALLVAARVRTRLQSDDERADLYLFLVAPPGAKTWEGAQRVVERNEEVVRKFLWLPEAAPSAWDGSTARFLDRTFLAVPVPTGRGPAGDLDPLSTSLKQLTAEGVLTPRQAVMWEEILMVASAGGGGTAEALLAAIDEELDHGK